MRLSTQPASNTAVEPARSEARDVHRDGERTRLPGPAGPQSVSKGVVPLSLAAAKAESDAKLSKLIEAMLSELESEEGTISDDETDSLETLVQICWYGSRH